MASNIMNGVIPKMATHGDKPEEESSQPKLKEQQQHYRLQRHLPNDPQTWRESSLGLTNGDGDDSGDGSKQWQGTPQGATNSLDTSYDLLFDGEYPVEYSCEDKIDIVNEPTSATTLSFYYEATLPKGQDPVANVEALEWSFLEGLARRTGLTDKCNFAKQYNNNVRDLQVASLEDSKEDESFDKYQNKASTRPEQRIRNLDDVSLAYPVTIYSINRNPSDTIKEGCVLLEGQYNDETTQCLFVRSEMKVHYRGQFNGSLDMDRKDVETYVKAIFERDMNDKPHSLRAGYVESFAYVGDGYQTATTSIESPPQNTLQAGSSDGSGGSAVTASVVAGVCSFAILGVLLLFLKRRRRDSDDDTASQRKETQVDPELQDDSDLIDLENGITRTASSAIPQASAQSRKNQKKNHFRSKSLSQIDHHGGGTLLRVTTSSDSISACAYGDHGILAETRKNDDDGGDLLPGYQIPVLMRSKSDPTDHSEHGRRRGTPSQVQDASDSPKPPVQEVPMLIRTSNLMIPDLPELQNLETGVPFVDSQESNDSTSPKSPASLLSAGGALLTSDSSHSASSNTRSAALPPRPPIGPKQKSIKLKKKRRRRKKKKKVTLARVNSRENINEMSMIAEEDEGTEGTDGSEYTWESGSDFSGTEGDDLSSTPSSTTGSSCMTPVRNPTPTHSRNASPDNRLSPQDELFPSDVFSTDFEFLIEAPDFPYQDERNNFTKEKKAKSKTAPSPPPTPPLSSTGVLLQASPVKKGTKDFSPNDSKKVKKLPPSWV